MTSLDTAPDANAVAVLERACAATWPAADTAPLGDWLLRANDGWTNRANTALVLGDPGMPVPQAIRYVEDWYRRRGMEPGFAIPYPSAVADGLTGAGWRTITVTDVMTTDITNDEPAPDEVRIRPRPDPDWLRIAVGGRGPLPGSARRLLVDGPDRGFGGIVCDGETVAAGRVAIADGVAVVSSIEVVPHARRRGLARRMMRGLTAWAARRGAVRMCLQVVSDNDPALALYTGLGYTKHHTYAYLRP